MGFRCPPTFQKEAEKFNQKKRGGGDKEINHSIIKVTFMTNYLFHKIDKICRVDKGIFFLMSSKQSELKENILK